MTKKNETTKKTQEVATSIVEGFQKVLAEHGFNNHKITKFNIAPALSAAPLPKSVLTCPPNFHKEWICRTVNGVTSCGWECVKN